MQSIAHPFVKWAGGKTQLLPKIRKHYPHRIKKYCEPFVGGGAVLFDVLQKCHPEEILINDVNAELINTYSQIKSNVRMLSNELVCLQNQYFLKNQEERKLFFLEKRNCFNSLDVNGGKREKLEKATLFIFLNKTCFNGLYRVNKKGEFNVPFNNAKNPLVCDEENLKACSELLKNVKMKVGDYSNCKNFIDSETFVYLDPPYRPLTKTAAFTSYSENGFDDSKQIELAEFVESISDKGAKILLSNSDPKNISEEDNFFDDLYQKFEIERINATRAINSDASKRGKISEILVSNFENPDYIPVDKNTEESFSNHGKFFHKIELSQILFDKTRLDYANPIYEETVENIVYFFHKNAWEPITVDNDFYLKDGQHRLAAAKVMGLKYIDVFIYDDSHR